MDVETILRGISLSEEFSCELGDPRRTRRVQFVAARLAQKPELSLPELFEDPSELEATYRLLRNPKVTVMKLLSPHVAATAKRCEGLDAVLAVHDTTEFSFAVRDDHVRQHLSRLSKGRQGFYGHLSLAVSADGLRAPLGVLNCFAYVHQSQVDETTGSFWTGLFGKYESESERWAKSIVASEARVGATPVIHVCDREADMNDVLQTLHRAGSRYVIRAYQGRKSVDGTPVVEVPRRASTSTCRTIELSARPVGAALPKSRKTFAPRRARQAAVVIRGHRAKFGIGLQDPVEINVVEVIEENPPDGEAAVHWTLLTSESIDSEQELLRVIDIYRSRWLIEEFFKAIKTGCSYDERQLESASTLLAVLGITLVLAWQLLLLRHLSRLEEQHPEMIGALPAAVVMTPQQLAVLIALTPKLKWPPSPSIRHALRGVARLGGHLKSNGPPGWQVLGRGYQKLMAIYEGVSALAAAGLVIDA
jgi:hypothetical protein